MSIAKHYETGESLPEDVYLKLLAARTFRAGSLSLRQVSAIWVFRFFDPLSSLLCRVFYFLLCYCYGFHENWTSNFFFVF